MLTPIIKLYTLQHIEGKGCFKFCDRVVLPQDATFRNVGTTFAGILDKSTGKEC
jgi:hypothetical protein